MTDEQSAMDRLIGSAVYGFVRAGIAAGLTPTRAMALAGFGVIEGTLGREAIRAIGLPTATASDWRREIAAMVEHVGELQADEGLELEVLNELLPALGLRDLRMVRGGGDG